MALLDELAIDPAFPYLLLDALAALAAAEDQQLLLLLLDLGDGGDGDPCP